MKSTATDTPTPLLQGELYRLFMNIVLLGFELGKAHEPLKVLDMLVELRPDLPHAASARGMCIYGMGRREEGLWLLQEAAESNADYQMGKALLATCMAEESVAGWEGILEAIIEDGRDEHAIGLAHALLGRTDGSATAAPATPAHRPAHAMWA